MKKIMNGRWEDFGRHRKKPGARGRHVGPAGPTMAPAGAPLLGFWPPFWKLPLPPPRSHLGPWLGQFDPTAHVDPTGLINKGADPLLGGIKSFGDPFIKSLL